MAACSREYVFDFGALAAVKECKIITLKYTGKACRSFIIFSVSEDIIL